MIKKACLWLLSAVLLLSGLQFAGWKSGTAYASTDSGRIIPLWYMSFSGLPNVEYGLDSGTFHQGSQSLRIAYRTAKASNVYMNISQTVTVKPNTKYDLGLWVKGSSLMGVSFGANWEPRTSVGAGTFDWKKVTSSYTTKAGETTLTFRILMEDQSDVIWLDDLTMKETGTDLNLLRNGGFDSIGETIPLSGFEDLSQWTSTGSGGTVVAESVYGLHTEGEQAARLTFTKTSSQADQIAYVLNLEQERNLSRASTVTMDVYPLSQTTSSTEPLFLRVKDATGAVSEAQLPKLLANRWNGVKLEFANSAVRSRIFEISLYAKTGSAATGWDSRTSVGYVVDQLNAVILKQVQPITGTPEPGGVLPGSSVSLATATEGAAIWYTTDGSDPASSGTRQLYTVPIPVTSALTVKAYGLMEGYESSPVSELLYSLGTGVAGETLEYWNEFKEKLGSGTHLPLFPAESFTVDGNLEEWGPYSGISLPNAGTTQNQVTGWAGAEDLSAEAKFAYDEDYFYVSAKVRDDVHQAVANADMWIGDSVQFAFSENGIYGAEYGLNLLDGETGIWRWKDSNAALGRETVTAKAVRSGNDTMYEARIPWEAVFAAKPGDGPIHFTMLVNDNDGGGRKGWVEWTSGIGRVKDGKQFAALHRVPPGDPWSFWLEVADMAETGKGIPYKLNLVNYSSEARTVQLYSELLGVDRTVTVPAGAVLIKEGHFSIASPGSYSASVTAAEPDTGMTRNSMAGVEAVINAEMLNGSLNAISARLPELEALLAQAEAQGLSTDYERVNYTVIKDFIGYGKEDVSRGVLTRAYYVVQSLETLYGEAKANLLAYLDGTLTPLAVPRYITGELGRTDYGFTGETRVRSTGTEEERPVFLNGYGHFNQVRKDIGKFQDFGANVIQIEIGPHRVITAKEGYIPGYSTGGSATGSVEVDSTVAHSGGQSLKLVNTSPKQANIYRYASQSMVVKPNTVYRIKAWVKGEGMKNGWFPGNAGWDLRQALPLGTYDWQEVGYTYKTGAAETSFSLVFLSENQQTLWLDDLSMTETGGTENLVGNPGFEERVNWEGSDPAKDYFGATDYLKANVIETLKAAEEQNIAVNLLLSPHYFPDWLLKKYPEVRSNSTGFIKYLIDQPKAKEVIEDYLRTVIPLVKDYKSLLTVTLSNEPVFQTNRDTYYLPLWHDWLRDMYGGSLAELNRVYGSVYASFDEMPMPLVIEGKPIVYDWVTFNNKVFSEWHQWMADIVHDMAPGLPVQSKTMAKLQDSLNWGVDYEQFSGFSQINGNDAYNVIGDGSMGFIKEMSFYDMQRSFNPAPIFNSEHHFIKDGDDQYTPDQAKRVRAILWQGAVHGKSASTSWVWERTYDDTSDFVGSLLHRPDVVADIGQTNHDLNRLAEEVTALQNETPKAAILYSLSSGIYNNAWDDTLRKSYAALVYSGQRIGFVSEKQAAQGGLSGYELLLVPASGHVSADTLAAVKAFAEAGGKVVLIGEDTVSRDQHDQPLPAADIAAVKGRAVVLPASYEAGKLASPGITDIQSAVLPLLEELEALPVRVMDIATGEPATELGWQTSVYKGRLLLNLVNYTGEGKRITVLREGHPAGGVLELIGNAAVNASDLELQPYGVYLLDLGSAVSAEKSVLGAAPERLAADGTSGAALRLELRDINGNPAVGGAAVQFTSSLGLLGPVTVEGSVYTAYLTSASPGTAVVGAVMNGAPLLHTVQVSFYQPDQESSPPPHGSSGDEGNEPSGDSAASPASGAGVSSSSGSAVSGKPDPGSKESVFPDLAGHWAEPFILRAIAQGWVNGYEDGSFRPDRPVTREELLTLLVRAIKPAAPAGKTADFADSGTISPWARQAVAEAAGAGWLEGYEDGTLRPRTFVSRTEMTVLLLRAAGVSGSQNGSLDEAFADYATVPEWATGQIAEAVRRGLVEGSGAAFRPAATATRAETVTTLLRLAASREQQ